MQIQVRYTSLDDWNTIHWLIFRDPHGFHRADDPDERKAHDGTLEYTSRDAHTGAHSRRGDLETLGYNLVHWAAGSLPWLADLDADNREEKVQASKIAYMENVVGFLTKCFGQDKPYPAVLEEYLAYVNDMDFYTDPDYDAIREMFEKCITGLGKSLTGKLVWNKPKPRKKKTKKVEAEDENSRASLEAVEDGEEDSGTGDKVRRSRRIQDADKEEEEKEEDTTETSLPYWEAVLSKNPERIMRKKKPIELSLKEADFDKRQKESLKNPTPEMERIVNEMEALEKLRDQMRDQDQLQEFNKQRTTWLKERWQSLEEAEVCDNTPAMQELRDRMDGITRMEEKFEFHLVVKEVNSVT